MSRQIYGLFANITEEFCDALALRLHGKNVLEIFGGNGYLSSELQKRGVNIKCTSILSDMDGHSINLFTNVENIDAVTAVTRYGAAYDVLIMAFPTITTKSIEAVRQWGEEKDVVYIGERASQEMSRKMLFAGCATDSLHYSLDEAERIDEYVPKNMLDGAIIGRFNHKKYKAFLIENKGEHYWMS